MVLGPNSLVVLGQHRLDVPEQNDTVVKADLVSRATVGRWSVSHDR